MNGYDMPTIIMAGMWRDKLSSLLLVCRTKISVLNLEPVQYKKYSSNSSTTLHFFLKFYRTKCIATIISDLYIGPCLSFGSLWFSFLSVPSVLVRSGSCSCLASVRSGSRSCHCGSQQLQQSQGKGISKGKFHRFL